MQAKEARDELEEIRRSGETASLNPRPRKKALAFPQSPAKSAPPNALHTGASITGSGIEFAVGRPKAALAPATTKSKKPNAPTTTPRSFFTAIQSSTGSVKKSGDNSVTSKKGGASLAGSKKSSTSDKKSAKPTAKKTTVNKATSKKATPKKTNVTKNKATTASTGFSSDGVVTRRRKAQEELRVETVESDEFSL
jgi:hypothetical protein